MNYKKLQVITFLALLVLGLIFAGAVIWPFLNIIALAAILAILFLPLMHRIERKVKSKSLAAGSTVLIFVLILVIPIALFGQILFSEISGIARDINSGALTINEDQIIQSLPEPARASVANLTASLSDLGAKYTSNIFASFVAVISNIASFFISVFLLLFTMYYLLRDGHKIKEVVMDISPIADSQEHILFKKVVTSINGVVKGMFLVSLVQGVVATVGFFIFGLPNPILWGLVTILAALVPTVGTSIVIIPAVIYLLITGNTGQAIGLAIWGAIAVGLIDNFISPKLVGSQVKLHPVMVLFAVLGGLHLFGFLGFLIGPILMAIFVALIEMYRTDFKSYLEN
jgi:predicted PurR-regulated permease PerM